MSSAVLKYTAKLYSNLNAIRKRIAEIHKLPETERQQELDRLYRYFKSETDVRVRLFNDLDILPSVIRCLTVRECIDRDIEYLKRRCDTDLQPGETKSRCNELVEKISKEFQSLFVEVGIDTNYIGLFISHLSHDKESEQKYVSTFIDDLYDREKVAKLLYSCYRGKYPQEPRIQWLVWGYIYGKNRLFEDWLPAVSVLFDRYDELVDRGKIPANKIRWERANVRSLHIGIGGLEDLVRVYTRDTRSYVVGDIDFAKYRDHIQTYKQGEFTVITPLSRESAVYWGWDTKWCTSRIDRNLPDIFTHNRFERYNVDSVSGKLRILKWNDAMYQLHPLSEQFMKPDDTPVTTLTKSQQSDFIRWIKSLALKTSLREASPEGILKDDDMVYFASTLQKVLDTTSFFSIGDIADWFTQNHGRAYDDVSRSILSLVPKDLYGVADEFYDWYFSVDLEDYEIHYMMIEDIITNHILADFARLQISSDDLALIYLEDVAPRMIDNDDMRGIRYLLQIGVKITDINTDTGEKLLYYVVKSRVDVAVKKRWVEFLLSVGANPNIRGRDGTPREVCWEPEICKLLT
jgi:hypothetical protein